MPTNTVKQRFESLLARLITKLGATAVNLPEGTGRSRIRPYARHPHHRFKRRLELLDTPPDLIDELLDIYAIACSHRYLFPRPRPGGTLEKREDGFERRFKNDADLWRKDARVSYESFKHIRDKIKNDAVFKNDSECPQDPVSYQLLLALCRFGGYGNKSSYVDVAAKLGVSVGSVDNYTRRVIAALCRLTSRYIKWPEPKERDVIKQVVGRESIFFACVGFMDGSFIPFTYKPTLHAASDFFGYKRHYGINALAVCDPWKRFTYLRLGAVGSVNDQAAYEASDLGSNIDRYLRSGEYLLADSGFAVTPKIISAFKRPPGGDLTRDQKRFNYELSRVRISIEHSFGILKERFQSLKEMRHRIRGQDSMRALDLWVRACFTLHNILMGDLRDESFLEGEDRSLLEERWHRRELEDLRDMEHMTNGPTSLSRTNTSPRGHPLHRAAILEEAKSRGWRKAFDDDS